MDTFADGPSQQPERPAGEPRRRRRWPFVVGGLMALGLIGLAIVAVVLILAAGGTRAPAVYAEEYVAGDGADTIAPRAPPGEKNPGPNAPCGGHSDAPP